jgi:hypothetical protein
MSARRQFVLNGVVLLRLLARGQWAKARFVCAGLARAIR